MFLLVSQKNNGKKIQKKEKSTLKSKDLGAWGPRFAKSEAPTGDWMVSPNLWTSGFQSKKSENKVNTSAGTMTSPQGERNGRKFLIPAYAYFLSFLLVECLFTTFSLILKKRTGSVLAATLSVKRGLSFSSAAFAKISALKLVLSACFTKIIASTLLNYEDKMEKTEKRTLILASFGSMMGLFTFALRRLIVF